MPKNDDGLCMNGPSLALLSWNNFRLRRVFSEVEGPSLRGTKLYHVPTLLEAGTEYRVQSEIVPKIKEAVRRWFSSHELAVGQKLKEMCVLEPREHEVFGKIIKDKTGATLDEHCTASNLESCINAAWRVLEHGNCVPDVEKLDVGSLGHICYEIMLMIIAENVRFVLQHDRNDARYVSKPYFDVSPESVVSSLADHPCFDSIVETLAGGADVVRDGGS